ncbi:MAG: sodium:proton antiporter [Candidatus Omnitrophica bacterium]|jgi:Multisubunit Na+/H+ antiporter, MnhC subunit|nr:sodium:proton antiporter [Candidatus Omnitrophota bacterium]
MYLLCFVLFGVGLYGIAVKRNTIKLIISVVIMNYAVEMFLVLTGFQWQGDPPIMGVSQPHRFIVDPLPQVLALITIIIGIAVTALLVMTAMRLQEKFKTFDLRVMEGKKEKDD